MVMDIAREDKNFALTDKLCSAFVQYASYSVIIVSYFAKYCIQ